MTTEKDTAERRAVALAIREFRKEEKNRGYIIDRDKEEYLESFPHLPAFFSYVRTLPTPTVLDIGTGNGKGITELAVSNLGEGIAFMATGLVRFPNDPISTTDAVKFFRTSAEVLWGIGPESVGGIIALYSVEYSKAKHLVAKRVDEILAPGGVFVGNFPMNKTYARNWPNHGESFARDLESYGHQVALVHKGLRDVITAVKPSQPGSGISHPIPVLRLTILERVLG